MGTLLLFGILVGLDNLQASSAIGMLPIERSRKWMIVLAFAFFEMLMPLLGLIGGQSLQGFLGESVAYIGPGILFITGMYVLINAIREKETENLLNSKWVLFGLPLSLSLDNLFAGVSLGAMDYPVVLSAVVIGSLSGGMCFIGLFLGKFVRNRIPKRVEIITGAYMMAMSILLFVQDIGEVG